METNTRNGSAKKVLVSTNGDKLSGAKTKFWAYFWWFFGGIFGAHHIYLGKDYQALVWFSTLGGFTLGWVYDLFQIPAYLDEANENTNYRYWFKNQVRLYKKPPQSCQTIIGQYVFSIFLAHISISAIPRDEVFGFNLRPLILLIPLAIGFGVWLAGSFDRARCPVWAPVIIAYLFYPSIYYIADDTIWFTTMSLPAICGFEVFKEWRLRPKKPSTRKRTIILTTYVFIFSGLCASYFYHNAIFYDSDGEEIKLSESLQYFFTSPMWLDLRLSLEQGAKEFWHQGFWATWQQMIELTDPRGEQNAFRVLGLSPMASQSEVTAKWRSLSKEHHPDKIKGTEEEKRKAQDYFMEIQKAYEVLSSAKTRRKRKNRKSEL